MHKIGKVCMIMSKIDFHDMHRLCVAFWGVSCYIRCIFSKKAGISMSSVLSAKKLTDTKYLNLFELEAVSRSGSSFSYYTASRIREPEKIKAVTKENQPDGVIVYGLYEDKVVLIRQFRYPTGDYIYEFPAGILEPGEDVRQAAIREMYEETGLDLHPMESGSYSRPFFTSAGLTDESCCMIFGRCTGTPTNCHQEASEDIQVVLADREECRRILREEKVALMCAYMLMFFIAGGDAPFGFLMG